MSDRLDDWNRWRRTVDDVLGEHGRDIAVLKTRQQIMADNEMARHTRAPQHAYWIVSGALGLIALILQLLAARGTP